MQWGGLEAGTRRAGSGYAKLSAAGGGESEAEHWAVPQSSAVRRKSVRQCDTAQPGRVPESAPKKSRLNGRDFFIVFSPPGWIHAAPGGLHLSRRDTRTRSFFEKSKFSAFSTRSGLCCVKNARNPQRIPVLFALHPLKPCEKSAHFFVFRKAFKNCRR